MKTLHLRSILSKSMRCTKTRNACIQHWPTERAQTSTKRSDRRSHNQCFKAEWIGLQSLPHLPYSPDLSPTNYHFFKHLNNFLQGKHFHNQQDAKKKKKMLSKVHWIPKHGFLCYRNKQTFLIGKNVLTLMIPILINRNEPNYNELKLTVQNHNHQPNIFYFL